MSKSGSGITKLWITSTGQGIPIEEMNTDHIKNAIHNSLYQKPSEIRYEGLSAMIDELHYRNKLEQEGSLKIIDGVSVRFITTAEGTKASFSMIPSSKMVFYESQVGTSDIGFTIHNLTKEIKVFKVKRNLSLLNVEVYTQENINSAFFSVRWIIESLNNGLSVTPHIWFTGGVQEWIPSDTERTPVSHGKRKSRKR